MISPKIVCLEKRKTHFKQKNSLSNFTDGYPNSQNPERNQGHRMFIAADNIEFRRSVPWRNALPQSKN
jgi:hypothetical protein